MGFLITGYYAVVSGWCLQYVYASIIGELHGDANYVTQYFQQFAAAQATELRHCAGG